MKLFSLVELHPWPHNTPRVKGLFLHKSRADAVKAELEKAHPEFTDIEYRVKEVTVNVKP